MSGYRTASNATPTSGEGGDSDWLKLKEALADKQWDFRSVDGLAKQTGISTSMVETLLKKHQKEVRVSYVPDSKGRTLYTLATKPVEIREILATAQAFLAKST